MSKKWKWNIMRTGNRLWIQNYSTESKQRKSFKSNETSRTSSWFLECSQARWHSISHLNPKLHYFYFENLIIIFISDFVSPIRKDNGRLNWVRVKIPSCGNIGRAVAACPELENMPFYLDRNVDQDIKFGDTASYGLQNNFVTFVILWILRKFW